MEALNIAQMIMRADWYYNMTEDYSAYKKGEASVKEVRHYINSREWTIDDVKDIKHEINNMLKIRSINNVIKKQVYEAWDERVDNLFRKVLNNGQ
jgi:hypothetical protein